MADRVDRDGWIACENVRQLLCHQGYINRFVSFPSMRNWTEVGAIGLDEEAVQRHGFRDITQHRGILKGQNSGEGKIEPKIQRIPC